MKLKWITLVLVGSFVLVMGSAFQSEGESTVDRVAQMYTNRISSFAEGVHSLREVVLNRSSNEEIIAAYSQLRLAYKEVEYLMYYADAEWVTNFINGAPLPHLEPKTSAIRVLEPEGMQRIEELVYEDEIDFPTLQRKVNSLVKNTDKFVGISHYHHFTEREIFEAVRFELIRILSQGITGFDTPGSDRAIIEAATAFAATRDGIRVFDAQLAEVNAPFANAYFTLWDEALAYLQANPDFDSFQRGVFTRMYIEPLFEKTVEAQDMLYIEFKDETTLAVQSVNYRAKHIFSEELINPFFFTFMNEDEYTPEKVELGRTLFYDPVFSENMERSCASCHKPELAFTDGQTKSTAFHFDGTVNRNSPTLVNAVLAPRFFHDLRVTKLESQFNEVLANPSELNSSYLQVANRILESEEYVALFKQAFGANARIDKRSVETALSAFVTSLQSFNSPVDKWLRGEGEVSESVERGYDLFMGKAACGTCHFAPTFSGLVPPYFTDIESEVLGVPVDTAASAIDPDLGRAGGLMREASEIYNHSFKTVTVRNIAVTGPYMHNGVYETLEEVLDFYNDGGGTGHGLDVPNQTLPFDELNLNEQEFADLKAFMEALTDLPKNAGAPESLPVFANQPEWNSRVIGGTY